MRTIERICLYLVIAFVAVQVLDRAVADDEKKGAGAAVAERVRTRQLEIVGAKGNVALRLGTTSQGGGVVDIYNAEGKRVVQVITRADGDGEIRLHDAGGILRSNLGGDATGGYLNVWGPEKKSAAYIGADASTKGGYMAIYAPGGTKAAEVTTHAKGAAFIASNVGSGKRTAILGTDDASGHGVMLVGTSGGEARVLASAATDVGRVAVSGGNHRLAGVLSSNAKGGSLELRNVENDRQIAFLGTATDTGTGMLALSRPDGKLGIAQFTSPQGGQHVIYNGDGNKAAFFGVSGSPAGNGLLYVARKDGQRLFEAGANAGRGGYMSIRNSLDQRVLFLGASGGTSADDGVVEVARRGGKLGVVLRAYGGGSSVRVYDSEGKVKSQVR